MKMIIIESLGMEEGKLLVMAREALGGQVEIVYYNTKTMGTTELIEHGKNVEVIVVSNLPLNIQIIEGCRNLKLLVAAFTGADHIATDVYGKNGITVRNCAGYSTCAMASLVFGMLISLCRDVIPCDKVYWEGGTENGLVGFELEGKTFGVVGTGAISLRVVTITQALGCRVLAYSRAAKDVLGVRYADLETLLAERDVVPLRTPPTEETRGLTDGERIGLVKRNVVLANTARGSVVDSDVLAKALKEGRIAGACTNAFENGPPVREDHPPFSAPNIIVASRVVSAAREALIKRAVIVFNNVVNYLDGIPRNVIG